MKTLRIHLSGSRTGRIILHLTCIANGGSPRWHFQGIAREIGLVRLMKP